MRLLKNLFLVLLLHAAGTTCAQPWIPLKLVAKQVPFNGGSINFVEAGEGDALIFVHAGFQDLGMWRDQLQYFQRDHRVIALDLPGHGSTVDGSRRPDADSILLALMDALQIGKASIVGLSFGSAIALEFAGKHPDRVSKLVMASPAVPGIEEVQQLHPSTLAFFNKLMKLLAQKDTAAAALHFVQAWYVGPIRTRKQLPAKLYRYGYNTTLRNMRSHHASGWADFKKPLPVHRLAQVRMPVLLLTGSSDMRQVALVADYLQKQLPNVQTQTFVGVAHMLNVEQPERFNRAVKRFLLNK